MITINKSICIVADVLLWNAHSRNVAYIRFYRVFIFAVIKVCYLQRLTAAIKKHLM